MTFMEEIIAHSMPLWEEAAEEEFLKRMGTDTLDKQRFLDYITVSYTHLDVYKRQGLNLMPLY